MTKILGIDIETGGLDPEPVQVYVCNPYIWQDNPSASHQVKIVAKTAGPVYDAPRGTHKKTNKRKRR